MQMIYILDNDISHAAFTRMITSFSISFYSLVNILLHGGMFDFAYHTLDNILLRLSVYFYARQYLFMLLIILLRSSLSFYASHYPFTLVIIFSCFSLSFYASHYLFTLQRTNIWLSKSFKVISNDSLRRSIHL